MSRIHGVGNNIAIQKVIAQPVLRQASTESANGMRASDKLELSGVSHLLATLKTNNDIRMEKVAAAKAQIEAGTYEDDAKLATAVDRLIDDLDI